MKNEVDFPNYVTKADLKTQQLQMHKNFLQFDLAFLKPEIDRLDNGQLKTTPIDLSKLGDVVKNEVVSNLSISNYISIVYGKLHKEVNATQTTDTDNAVKKTEYDTKISEIKSKILNHEHAKYITTQEFNKFPVNFAARLVQAKLHTKDYINDFLKVIDFGNKLKILEKN